MAVTYINHKKCTNLYICTFIVDPNHFYICEKSTLKSEMIKRNEALLESYLKKNKTVFRAPGGPRKGEFVAYLHKDKHIRCEVLDVKEMTDGTRYVLFANDYGFQFRAYGTFNMYKLSTIFKHLPSPVMKVGLDVLPATKQMNYRSYMNMVQYHHKWTDEAVEKFRKYFDKCVIVNFEPTMPDVRHNDITFGNLIVIKKTTGSAVSLGERLIVAEMALAPRDSTEFWKYFSKTDSAHTEYVDDPMNISLGIPVLPSLDWHFRSAAKALKRIRDKKLNKEWTEEEKQNVKKVLSWMNRNEAHAHDAENPDLEDLNEEEELYELYVEMEEKKFPEIPHASLPLCESRHVPKKLPPIKEEEEKPLKRAFTQSSTFLPGGFQIATHVCNMPRYVNNCEIITNSEEFEEFNEQPSMQSKKVETANDDLEWPDSE